MKKSAVATCCVFATWTGIACNGEPSDQPISIATERLSGGSANSDAGTTVPAACVVSLGGLTLGAGDVIQASIAGATLTAGTGSKITGNAYSSGDVAIGAKSTITGTLAYGGTLNEGAGDSIGNIQHTTVANPTIPTIAFTAGSAAVTVAANATKSITPGAYGPIAIGAGAHVTFGGGTFTISSLTVSSGAAVTFDTATGGVLLEVEGAVNWANGTIMASNPAAVSLYSQMGAVTLGAGLTFLGSVSAPGGAVSLGDKVVVTQGCIRGKSVKIGANVSITGSTNSCAAAANGTPCDDGNGCTQTDSCMSGVCVGSNPVLCTALDFCHVAGTCNQSSAGCSNPPAPAGTVCGADRVCDGNGTCGAAPETCEAIAWSERIQSPGNDAVTGIATDSVGNVYVGGETDGLDGQASAGGLDAVVLKFDAAGNRLWTRQFGSDGSDQTVGVAVSGTSVFAAGVTSGALDGNTNAGSYDAFLVKLDTAGNLLWIRQFGSPVGDSAHGVAVDPTGHAYVVGETGGSLFGQPSNGSGEMFLVQYDSDGNELWARQIGADDPNQAATGRAIATDLSSNVFVTGWTTSGGFDGHSSAGAFDFFLVKFDASGNKLWSVQDGSSDLDFAQGIATDTAGNVYVTGFTFGNLDGNTRTGPGDLFVTKYDTAGHRIWTRQRGAPGATTEALAVATDGNGGVFVTGEVSGALDGNPYSGDGFDDWFVVKYTSDGTWLWSRQSGIPSEDLATSIVCDSSGHTYVGVDAPQPVVDNHISFDIQVTKMTRAVCAPGG